MSSNTTEGEVGIHVTCEEPTNMIIFHAAPKHIDIEKESVSVTDISKHGDDQTDRNPDNEDHVTENNSRGSYTEKP